MVYVSRTASVYSADENEKKKRKGLRMVRRKIKIDDILWEDLVKTCPVCDSIVQKWDIMTGRKGFGKAKCWECGWEGLPERLKRKKLIYKKPSCKMEDVE